MISARLLVFLSWLTAWSGSSVPSSPVPSSPPAKARIVRIHNHAATRAFEPDLEKVKEMFDHALLRFAGKTDVAQAWKEVISLQDTVGIKVVSAPGPRAGTRVALAEAVVHSLIKGGLSPGQIIIWDKHLSDLEGSGFRRLAEKFHISLAGSAESGYDQSAFYENALIGNLLWGDVEFGKTGDNVGRKSFVSSLLTGRITRIINISPLLNHNLSGVNGNLYSLGLGSVDNTSRFESAPERLATALPELYAMPALGDRVALNIIDALICQYQGEQRVRLHYSVPLNEIWISKDPVALDIWAIQELERQRQIAKVPSSRPNLEIYQNASLMELGISSTNLVQIETVR